DILGISANASDLAKLVREAYAKGNKLAEATRKLVHHLFEPYGLVILDANEKTFKQSFIPILLDDILHSKSFEAISQTSHELEKTGIKAQVHPREINFFYIKDKLRERIVREQ